MSDKQSVIQQTCCLLLAERMEPFFDLLSDLQLSAAQSLLTNAPRNDEYLSKHAKTWEELLHPLRLLCECEKLFYEWAMLPSLPSYEGGAAGLLGSGAGPGGQAGGGGGSSSKSKAAGGTQEDHVKYLYSQVPLGMRKTMQAIGKWIGTVPALPPHHAGGAGPRGAPQHSGTQQMAVQPQDVATFASLWHLFDELVSGYVMLKITMIQLYQNLSLPYVTASRAKLMNWLDLVQVVAKLRAKCERAFTHPCLVRVKQRLLLPELFLLEQLCALEGEATMLPALDFKATMFRLMRCKVEHGRWMARLLARDRELAGATGGGSAARKPPPPGGGKYAPLLPVNPVSLCFPSVLHFTHQLWHSLLCKATLLFQPILAAKSAEVRGMADELQPKLERLDAHYVALLDRMVRRLPNCYSASVVLDCSGLGRVVDPLQPLVLTDAATIGEQPPEALDEADGERPPPRASGGLANYPVLCSWPASRGVLEKWNLVSLLLSRSEFAATPGSAGGSDPQPAPGAPPKQTATCCVSCGPSHSPADLLLWDYESEVLGAARPGSGGAVPPGAVSFFVARLDPAKPAFLVLTMQAHSAAPPPTPATAPSVQAAQAAAASAAAAQAAGTVSPGGDALAPGGVTRESTGESSASLPHSGSAVSTGSQHLSSVSHSAPTAASALPTPAQRRRTFEVLLQEVTPLLVRLRHMHVFQQMQPGLGKKKS